MSGNVIYRTVRRIVEFFLVSLLNGISLGSVLFLLAAGFSLIFGVMGIVNLAHGALYMIGAFVGWTIAVRNGWNFWLAAAAGGLAAALLGLLIERGFLRQLHGRLNEQVLVTFGFVYIITNLSQWLWGPVARPPFAASFLSASINIVGGLYPVARLASIFVGLILATVLWWLQNKTRIGAIIRAGMDDREMATGLGINVGLVSIGVFFLGSFVAGFAGVTGAHLLGVNLQLSINVLLLALIVIVVGGMGSVEGALLGGTLIGLVDSFGRGVFPQLAMFSMYLTMIIVLLVRPTGLLGRKA